MDWKLQLIVLPVTDVDRAKAFYVERAGFHLDVDHRRGDAFRVVQMTPPGSACSITIGVGLTDAQPGSVRGLHVVVDDIEAAHRELSGRGVDASDVFHFEDGRQVPGPHAGRGDYESYVTFSDPDGNGWLVQEVGHGGRGA